MLTTHIRLASHEWGNAIMLIKAASAFRDNPELGHVTVIEHAGWFLEFNRDLVVVGTANDTAVLCPAAVQWWRMVNAAGGFKHVELCEV